MSGHVGRISALGLRIGLHLGLVAALLAVLIVIPGAAAARADDWSPNVSHTEIGTNVVQNSGFDANLAHWEPFEGSEAYIARERRSGSGSLAMVDGYSLWSQGIQNFRAGEVYALSAWGLTPNYTCMIGVKGNSFDITLRDYGSMWNYQQTLVSVPEGTSWMQIYVTNVGQDGNCHIDDVSLVLVQTPELNDGRTSVERPIANFSVRDGRIYDPRGLPFVIRGVNVNGPNWVWEREVTQDRDLIENCWGFNAVRVNALLFPEQAQWQTFTTNNDLDRFVETFARRGTVVIFEAHDRTGSYYRGDEIAVLVEWFRQLAVRYKNNPYVWFNVMNEPGGSGSPDKEQWFAVHRSVIQVIRDEVRANNIIIVDGTSWGQDAGAANTNFIQVQDSAILQWGHELVNFNGKTYDNIVYSIHIWDLWNYGSARLADYVDRVRGMGLSLIVGEYGINNGNADSTQAVISMFEVMPPRGIGRIAWAWDGGDANDLTVEGGGWQINDCRNPTNLSQFGQWVWNDR